MAKLETTVSGPLGEIVSFPGRIPAGEALTRARWMLEDELEKLQLQLTQGDLWTVTTHRGSAEVLSYEELHASED